MSVVRRIAGATAHVQASGQDAAPDTLWLREAFQGATTAASPTVTVESSMTLPAVLACVRIISNAARAVPMLVYRHNQGGGKSLAFDTQAYQLLARRPNPEHTSRTFWSLLLTHLILWGDAFIAKSFVNGQLVALWPIEPQRVRIERRNGVKLYRIRDAYGRETHAPYTSADIIHVMGLTLDGVRGLSAIELAREAVGAGLAMDAYRNYFFRNGAIPRGVLKVEAALDEESGARLRQDWEAKYRGLKNAGKVAILEEGLSFEAIAMPFADAQFVDQMKMSKAEIATMIFGIPASKIGAESGGSLTYKTVESDNLAFLTDAVLPWLGLLEEAVGTDPDLFATPVGKFDPPQFPEFNVDAYLRADTLTRFRSWQIATGNKAWMQPSEVRAEEYLQPDTSFDVLPAAAMPPAPDPAAAGA